MNKKLIISKTITFFAVVSFVVIFKLIFGEKNTLIGVTTVTASLMLLERDLTQSPFKNSFKLILLNLLIGISTYLSTSNMYLGIFVNFFSLFFISYKLCYNLRNPMYLPFNLQYLFLLANPVNNQEFPLRIAALITGALIIMITQVLVNKNKFTKSGNKILQSVCDFIISKMEYKEEYELIDDGLDKINSNMDSFRTMIYDKRESNYYLTQEGQLKLNLSVALESICYIINDVDLSKIDEDILKTLKKLLENLKIVLDNSKNKIDNNDFDYSMEELFNTCKEKDINNLLDLQLLDSMILLSDTTECLKNLDVKHYNIVDTSQKISNVFSDEAFKSFFVNRQSLRFCYAIRIAISITIGAFIMEYFHLKEGRWIIFTLHSLITPLYESSKSKTKDRIFATIIGSIIIVILFSIFKDHTSRMLIILLCGYLNGYAKQYKYSTIFVTISAIGSAALVDNVQVLTLDRIVFVCIGVIMALLANRFIFPYKLEDSIRQLKNLYHETVVNMLKEVEFLIEGKKEPHTMKNLMILTSLIEAKSRQNEKLSTDPDYNQIINSRRSLVSNIYELYIFILKDQKQFNNYNNLLKEINSLIRYCDEDIHKKVNHLQDKINNTNDINLKIILSSIIVILKELSHLNKLNKSM